MTGDVQHNGAVPVRTAALTLVRDVLAGLDEDVADAERIDRIRLLEEIKAQAAAAQARQTAAFVASQRAQQAAQGVPAERVGRGIAAQVGLARRVSPFHASRYVGWSTILTTELPHTFAALQAGTVSEWRAMLVARETVWLSREHRAVVDAELAPELESLGDRRVEAEARKIGYRLDPEGFVARSRAAEADRRVTLRPAPDAMARLTHCCRTPRVSPACVRCSRPPTPPSRKASLAAGVRSWPTRRSSASPDNPPPKVFRWR